MTDLATEIVRELLDYNPETGVFTWRPRGREWFPTNRSWRWWNGRFAGKTAGCISKNKRGYPLLSIKVLGKMYLASRLAFLWMGEPLPEQVDHPNGDSLDNRWRNLKASTGAENGKNRSMSRANTSGVTGVYWRKAVGKWQAGGKLDGKQHHLGHFDDLDEAAAVVNKFRATSGFSERHGKELAGYMT